MTDSISNSSTSELILLVNKILQDLSTIEADVTSHAEAVLKGRLSKSQQRLIRREQLKNCQPVPEAVIKRSKTFKSKRTKSSKRPKNGYGFGSQPGED